MKPCTAERKNLFRFLMLHPFRFARFVLRLPRIVFLHSAQKIKVRKGMKRPLPTSASDEYRNLFFDHFSPLRIDHIEKENKFDRIRLAGIYVPAEQKQNWSFIFKDIEDTFSLNRFGWLFAEMYGRQSAEFSNSALGWISDWIDTMENRYDHPAWESYSVSERLSNWPFILSVVNSLGLPIVDIEKKLAKSICNHIDYLLANLELKGTYTNNHILNNARGLYIGGLFIQRRDAILVAKNIFYEWIPRLFDKEGMLKENSSHYQFLICQRLEQIYFLSLSEGDAAFTEFLKQWFVLIRNGRDFLCVPETGGRWSMPYIGDISPDYKPGWTLPGNEKGWEKIKDSYGWVTKDELLDETNQKYFSIRISDKFARYDIDGATVFWHIPDGPVRGGSHGHYDIGSFLFFMNGEPVFIDPGRRSYDMKGSESIFARAHSSLTIDGLGPFCEDSRLNTIAAYPYQVSRVSLLTDEGGRPTLEIDTDGFKRFSSPVKWKRSFKFNEKVMIVSDCIEAGSDHNLETRFVISGRLLVSEEDEGVRIESENGFITLKVIDVNENKNWSGLVEPVEVSSEYGSSESAKAFVIRENITGNHRNTYEIRWT